MGRGNIFMSVAVVLNVSGATGTPPPDGQKSRDTIKTQERFKHLYSLRNESGQRLAIGIWRDKACAEAAKERAFSAEAQARRAELGLTLSFNQIYDSFGEL